MRELSVFVDESGNYEGKALSTISLRLFSMTSQRQLLRLFIATNTRLDRVGFPISPCT